MAEHRKIKYYGTQDMSAGWFLQEIESFFRHWDEKIHNPDINIILELYNIKQYFDTDMRLQRWDDTQFAAYKAKCKLIPEMLGRFCNTISNDNLKILYNDIEREYIDDFWQLICDYKAYLQLTPATMEDLINCEESIVWHILHQRVLATYFGQIIADELAHNRHTAERLIAHFLAAHEHGYRQLYFPAEFTQEMRDKVLAEYLECEDKNINYLKLLEEARSTKEFPISDRLKLKARKKKEALQEGLYDKGIKIPYGAKVTFQSIPDGSMKESYDGSVVSYEYSREWVEENQDYPTLLNNFIHLFKFVDRCNRCTFISLNSELGVLEKHLGINGKKDYRIGHIFQIKRISSLLQLRAYNKELQRLGIQIEELFKWFFEDYLKDEFNAAGFTYCPPSTGTTYVEKCKLLAIAIDGALKQYRLFCEDGYVDRELLEISSGHIVFSDIPSIITNKYVYPNSVDLKSELFLLFSDQSMMSYTPKTGSAFRTFPQLLMSENMTREDFEYYHQSNLDWLIKRGTIYVADDGRLMLDINRIVVLKDLFDNEVICPAYYTPNIQQQIEAFMATGDMFYENTLFSKPEQAYLNYMLNRAEFSNGLDLRNKYNHDTCPLDEKSQTEDYLELQKIMILAIIKINEEFCLRAQKK